MLDVSVRIEDQKLGALTRREARERLRRERIEPRQPIFTGHGEHRAIAEGRDRSPGGECALLAERVAEVPETRLVGDGARNPCERSRHQSTLARRAEACEREFAPERGDVPRPQQVTVDEAVHAGRGGIDLRTGGAHDRIGRDVDPRSADLPEIQLADSVGVDDRHLDVEAALGVAQQLDIVGGAGDRRTERREQAGAGLRVRRGTGQPPVAHLGDERCACTLARVGSG